MRKNTRKLLALLLAMVMCLSVFAGCSSEEGTTDTTNAATEPATEVTVPAVETSWADLTNAERYPLESDKTFTVATRVADPNERDNYVLFNELTGVEVDWQTMTGDTLTTACAGGEMPDAMLMTWGLDKATIYEYGNAGKLVNFVDYFQYMPNFQKVLEKHPNALDNFMNADGTVYSMPGVEFSFGSSANLVYVRLDMLEKAGWTKLPETTDEFLQCIQDVQEAYSDVEGFYALNFLSAGDLGYMEWNGYVDQYLFSAFGELQQTGFTVDDAGNVVLGCTTEQYQRYINYIQELFATGACETNLFVDGASTANKAKLAADQGAFAIGDMPVTTDNFETGTVDITIMGPLTSEWNSEKVWVAATAPGFQCNCINGELPEEDIITLVKWMDSFYSLREDPLNEEGTASGISLWIGLEGTNYVVDEENGTYDLIATGDYASGDDWRNNEGPGGSLIGSEFPYITTSETKYTKKQLGTRDNLWPYYEEKITMDVLRLTQDETDIYNDVYTDLNAYMETAFAKFITGEWTVEANWDQYISELESIGIQDLIDVYQAAYDRENG